MPPDPYALPAFILSIISLTVAGVGAITGVIALLWQIVTRTRGAHNVKVRAISNLKMLGVGFEQDPYIEIQVMNRGAAQVQMKSWAIVLPDGNGLMMPVPPAFPPMPSLPLMLAPGSAVSFYVLSEALRAPAAGRDLLRSRAVVYLATGQKVYGKRGQISIPGREAPPAH